MERIERRKHMRFKIRNKLLVGFSALFAILLTVVLLTLTQLSSTKNFSHNLTTNTLPTFNAIQDLNIGLQGSSASLQEWMLTGNEKYKTERNQIWQRIAKDRTQINQHTQNWHDAALDTQWKEIESLLQQLQTAQTKTEGIAHSDQENTALLLLKKESDPTFLRIFQLISQIIDAEKKQPATEVRKKLLINMADFRGNLASAVGNVNLFSITGNGALLSQIEAKLKEVNKAEVAIQSQINLLTNTQAIDFKEIQTKKIALFDVLGTILKLRQKDDWNLANYVLNNEVSALLNKIQIMLGDLSDQTNNGLIQQLQQRLVHDSNDVNKSLHFLQITQWVLLALGIMLSVIITWMTSRSIVKPIQSAIEIASRIAKGERGLTIRIIGNDESADLLRALSNMYNGISEAEQKLKNSEGKIKEILDDLQTRIVKYRNYIAAVSSGDLTQKLEVNGDDDLAKLGGHLNAMTHSLSNMTLQILDATNEISAGLNQLESAATSQAASASQQASSVTEVSSVVEEIKTTSQQTLEKASELGASAEKTHQEGEKWQQSVHEMAEFMRSLQEKIKLIAETILSLSDKTQQIGEITEAVSDIAKQSKMLALNASIEAAKAGEVGRGFAVVAGEVKELAEKSQGSTERVQKILQDIRQTAERAVIVTEEGTKSVNLSLERTNQMGKMMDAFGSVIEQSSIASHQIVAAVREESVGIDQVVLSIAEIDKVTNQFSSATEQTKSASVNLASVVHALKKSVGVYKLANTIDAGDAHAD